MMAPDESARRQEELENEAWRSRWYSREMSSLLNHAQHIQEQFVQHTTVQTSGGVIRDGVEDDELDTIISLIADRIPKPRGEANAGYKDRN